MLPNNNLTPIITYIPTFYNSNSTPVPVNVTPKLTQVTIPKQNDGVTSSAVFTLTAIESVYYKAKVLWSPNGSLVSINASEGRLEAGKSTDIILTVTSPTGILNLTNYIYKIGIFADGYNGVYPDIDFIQVEEK